MRREALVRFDGGSPGQRSRSFGSEDKPGVLFDGVTPQEGNPERGRQGNASSERGGRDGAKRVRIPPAGRALRSRVQRGWRGDFRSERSDGPGRNRRPGDRPKENGGREELNHERRENTKRLPVRPDRRRCRTANSPSRWVPESFCVLLGENSRDLRGDYAGVTPGHTGWAWSQRASSDVTVGTEPIANLGRSRDSPG